MTEKLVKDMSEKDKGFYAGYIVCLSSLVHGHGTNTESYELFREIGFPSAKMVRDLDLGEYDREAMNLLRKETLNMRNK